MHIRLKLFCSLLSSPKFPYICFGLLIDHLQGVTNYTYFASILSVNCYMQSRSAVIQPVVSEKILVVHGEIWTLFAIFVFIILFHYIHYIHYILISH
jgi:hypothetical protein